MCFYLLGYLFDKQKYSQQNFNNPAIARISKMYGNKYRFNAEIQEMPCWEGKLPSKNIIKNSLFFLKLVVLFLNGYVILS